MAFLALQVERHAFLIAVQISKIAALVVFEGQVMTRIVTTVGPFDLDDPGTEVGKEHGRIGTGIDVREI